MDGADACGNLALLLFNRALGWAGLKRFPGFFVTVIGDPTLEAAFAMAEQEIHLRENIAKKSKGYVPDVVWPSYFLWSECLGCSRFALNRGEAIE